MTDYGIPPELPCCGVAVLCYILNKNFKPVFQEIKQTYSKPDDWYGGMTIPEVLLMLIDNGIDFKEIDGPCTLDTFAYEKYDTCIINTNRHFQIVKDGFSFDQKGWSRIFDAEHRHEKILNIIKIF
jgi:hypothetical protein